MNNNNNIVEISGIVECPLRFSHKKKDTIFNDFVLKCVRLSGQSDLIPVIVPDKLFEQSIVETGKVVKVFGQIKSYKTWENGVAKIKHFVYAKDICECEYSGINKVSLIGKVYNIKDCRQTPLGRRITECVIEVERRNGDKDYIPCLFWEGLETAAAGLCKGDCISVDGRLQSRIYFKRFQNESEVTITTYEVSVSMLQRG